MTTRTFTPDAIGVASPRLNTVLWAAQIFLALAFGLGGVAKFALPIATLAPKMTWVTAVPPALVQFIGAVELAGALGLILPSALRIQPWLTPAAAFGIVTVMLLAMGFHLARQEYQAFPVNLLIISLSGFIAWGRLAGAVISERR